jgi:hypothetical protein
MAGVITLAFLYSVLVVIIFGSKMLNWAEGVLSQEVRHVHGAIMDAMYGHGDQVTIVQLRRARMAQKGLKRLDEVRDDIRLMLK